MSTLFFISVMGCMSPNSAPLSAVKAVVNAALIVVISLTLFLTGCKESKEQRSGKPPVTQREPGETHRRLQNMASVVSDMQGSPDAGKARQQVGELWIQANHLKSEGRDSRNVEGLLSDLEWNLRSSQQDASARRHIVNELEYEIQALKRKNR